MCTNCPERWAVSHLLTSLRGHSTTTWTNFTQFRPPTSLEWTLYLYSFSPDHPLIPFLIHIVIEWPLSMLCSSFLLPELCTYLCIFFYHQQRQDPLHGYVCSAKANRSTAGIWQQVSRLTVVQATRSHEHARRHRRKGPFHHYPFRLG